MGILYSIMAVGYVPHNLEYCVVGVTRAGSADNHGLLFRYER